ncbi:AAA family ATPase [Thermomonospora echinospora]|uniref:AAA family ATPase n=1 Tax=Thermomonospora echinospora TaxID=1992 RepID=UPI000CDEBE03|nr:AAA family ATPase [Thermomonospora echinospora]
MIRVLMGSADRDLVASLTTQLHEISEVTLAGVEGTSGEVVQAIAGGLPGLDVILLHQELGPQPATDLIRELAIRHPHLAVVLVADEATAAIYGAAMAAGARGVIARDSTVSELQSRIESAAEWSRSMRRHFAESSTVTRSGRMGSLLAVCGSKGGTGATTLAVHVAMAAAETGQSVCLVDMDLQKGDLPSYLDIHHRRSIIDLISVAEDLDGTALAEALFVHQSGLHLLLAPPNGEDAESVSARVARRILAALRSRYDLVVIDCGSHMFDGNAVAVELADRVLVTCTPDLPSLRGAKRLGRLWDRLGIRKEEDASAVFVRHHKRNEIQPDLARKMLGMPLLAVTVPADFRALEEAVNTGLPSAVRSNDYRRAIARIVGELELEGEPDGAPDPASDKGASLYEFVALLPLLGVLVLIAWQIVLVGLTLMHSGHAANEAARAVSVLGYDTPAAQMEVRKRTVARISGPWGDEEHLSIEVGDGFAKVTIETPGVVPGWWTSFDVSSTSRIVYEGDGDD